MMQLNARKEFRTNLKLISDWAFGHSLAYGNIIQYLSGILSIQTNNHVFPAIITFYDKRSLDRNKTRHFYTSEIFVISLKLGLFYKLKKSSYNLNKILLSDFMFDLVNMWNDKQCRPWSDCSLWAVWSGSTLFAQTMCTNT